MKRAVSVSLGSSKRDKRVKVNLDGQEIRVERIGTNMLEALLTAYVGKGRRSSADGLKILPTVTIF